MSTYWLVGSGEHALAIFDLSSGKEIGRLKTKVDDCDDGHFAESVSVETPADAEPVAVQPVPLHRYMMTSGDRNETHATVDLEKKTLTRTPDGEAASTPVAIVAFAKLRSKKVSESAYEYWVEDEGGSRIGEIANSCDANSCYERIAEAAQYKLEGSFDEVDASNTPTRTWVLTAPPP